MHNFANGVLFWKGNFCGNLFWGSWKKSQKSQKLEPAKISCLTVVNYYDGIRMDHFSSKEADK